MPKHNNSSPTCNCFLDSVENVGLLARSLDPCVSALANSVAPGADHRALRLAWQQNENVDRRDGASAEDAPQQDKCSFAENAHHWQKSWPRTLQLPYGKRTQHGTKGFLRKFIRGRHGRFETHGCADGFRRFVRISAPSSFPRRRTKRASACPGQGHANDKTISPATQIWLAGLGEGSKLEV